MRSSAWKFGAAILLALFLVAFVRKETAAAVWTDLRDYPPGARVVIHGDNGDDRSFSANESVLVTVRGPHGFGAACRTVADLFGVWSCAFTLPHGEYAFGTYTYTAQRLGSSSIQSGSFTSARSWYETRLTDLRPGLGVHGSDVIATVVLHVNQCTRSVCNDNAYCTTCRLDAIDPQGMLVRLRLGTFAAWSAADVDGLVTARLPVPRKSDWLEATFSGADGYPCASARERLIVRWLRDMPEARAKGVLVE